MMFSLEARWIAFCLFLLVCMSGCTKTPEPRTAELDNPEASHWAPPVRPNILVVVVDTLRFDVTDLAGGGISNTPFLRQLSKEAVAFRRAYSTFDSTPGSHFSLLTGYIIGLGESIDNVQSSLPYQLKKIGYQSFGVASNANLSTTTMPILRGFESYVCLQERWLLMTEVERRQFYPEIDSRIDVYDGRRNEFNRMSVFGSASRVMPILKEKIKTTQRPFFGFVNFIDPHDPYYPDPAFYNRSEVEKNIKPDGFDSDLRFRRLTGAVAKPDNVKNELLRTRLKQRILAAGGNRWELSDDLTDQQLKLYKMRYEAEVKGIDARLEELFGYLQQQGSLDETLLIITSDHGEAFGEKGYLTHSFSNQGDREATQRVPLLMYFPKMIPVRAKRVATICSIADIPPTIYEIVGIESQPLVQNTWVGNFGRSLLPTVTGTDVVLSRNVTAETGRLTDSAEQERLQRERLRRLRTLGYLK